MPKRKAIKPQPLYNNDDIEPFVFKPAICPNCGQEVPYTNYCCNCGVKFISPEGVE